MSEKSLKATARQFPSTPGVYLMRDAKRKILYVGKAKDLRARTSSYFMTNKDMKSRFLIKRSAGIEAILTATEYEALILENTLIKKHAPHYNINLKDGKSYPVIRITQETFPRIFRTRRIIRDGSSYYGPYPNVKTVDIYIELIRKLYPLRRCKTLRKRANPCLYHHIGRCAAPCVGKISEEEYGKKVRKIKTMLSGRTIGFRKELEKEMRLAATELAFERAAEIRDALSSLELLESEPKTTDFLEESRDYIDCVSSGPYIAFALIQMRGGRVSDRQFFVNEYAGELSEAMPEFLLQYYSEKGHEKPKILFLSTLPNPLIQRFFIETSSMPIKIMPVTSKHDRAIQAMVRQNAGAELDRFIREKGEQPALEELQKVLSLPTIPRCIEGFDISHLQGKHSVASLVYFVDGHPDRSGYRHYKIRSTEGVIDDYRAIAEVITRRYQRLKNEGKKLPDLILVDGGKGQVSAALRILNALDLAEKVSLVGLSKRNEELWFPGNSQSLRLPEGDPCLRILQYVRDETHRFATGYNRRLRSKEMNLSTLEGVPGIGPAKSAKLIKAYNSLEGIYERSAAEIAKTAGIGEEVAETVSLFLGKSLKVSRHKGPQ